MALRKIISKVLLPNFESDLGRALSSEVNTVSNMVDNMLASPVFGYTSAGRPSSATGSFARGTASLQSPASDSRMVKVYYPCEPKGLMQDPQESWHHVRKSL